METILNIAVLFFGWVPVMILLVSGIHHKDAGMLWKKYGIASLAALAAVWLYSSVTFPGLASLIGWGVIAGIALTIALDVVRLAGVKLGTMPMDMPMSFGLRATGLFSEVQKRMMAKREKMGMKIMPYELTMFGAAAMMKPIIMEVLVEKKAQGRVMFWGYIWHFLNGIAFGLTYTLVFGGGHWLIALGLGLTIWILMMLVMPGLMNGAKVTANIFFTALVAHIVMVIPLIYIPPAVLSLEAAKGALLAFLVRLVGI